MNKTSAAIAIILALGGGFLIGNLTGKKSGGEEETVELTGEQAAAAGQAVERFKIPVTDKQPVKGPEDALVTIVEYSDFQCPFCSRVTPTIKQIFDQYKGKVRVVWRNNPLPFHKDAMPAAELAMEAFAQGGSEKFWKMHDILFENQRALTRADLEKYAAQAGLDVGKVKAALDSGKHTAAIRADQELATKLGARGTPSFFINGRSLRGAQPFENFKAIIDDEVKRAEALVKAGVKKKAVYAALTKDGLTEEAKAPEQPQQPRKLPDPNAVYKVPVGAKQPIKGPKQALVTIVQYSDFQCPFCSRVEPTIDEIMKNYGKDVRVVWANNPLPFHPQAMPAAEAAMEAYAQGGDKKFWAMHKAIFEKQEALRTENIGELLEGYAKQIGINPAGVKKALESHVHKEAIEKEQALARQIGASGTPAFFINGRRLSGAQPYEAFKKMVDEELAKAKELTKKGVPLAKLYDEIIKDGATAPKFVDAGNEPADDAEPDPNKKYTIAVPAGAPTKGAKAAKVVIQEFSDFQCPFCSRVVPTMKQLMDEYGTKVKVVWRNYPLPFHQQAMPAAEAAMEVYEQAGDAKFWAYHDKLFENQTNLAQDNLIKLAQDLGGINTEKLKAALESHKHQKRVQSDMEAVDKAGARIGTPSFFINGRLLQGAQPYEAFKAAVEQALKEG